MSEQRLRLLAEHDRWSRTCVTCVTCVKVDLVVAHLLRDGSPEAALTYLRKARLSLVLAWRSFAC